MKGLLKLLSPVPLVTMSAGGLAFLTVWVGYRLHWPRIMVIAIVAAILVIWLLVLWIVRLTAARKGEALEKSIDAQAQRQITTSRPGREKDIEQIRNQLLEAIAALKASRVGKGKKGASSLYVLPWYMIIGPPAAGKTTLLQNSGLNYPYLDPARSRSSVKGVGGTRNCDWWFSDEAVILDTAGRYVLPVEADDTQEWLAFLDLLRKNRGRKPINGLMVGVSVQDLIGGTDEELESHALKIRSRVDELIKQLGITFPVYVVFTKCDLIRGFVEFFGSLSKTERAQAWGATIARDRTTRQSADRIFDEEMDRLAEAVSQAKVSRLAQVTDADQRPEVLFFPLQFQATRARLSRFLEILFRPNPYHEVPIFRGFYFTSGTQEGRPIDQVLNAMLRGFGIQGTEGGMIVEPSQTKSYFIEDVFSKIVFPDRNIAGPSAEGERRRRALRVKSFIAGSVVLALFLIVLGTLYATNRALVVEARSICSRAAASLHSGGGVLHVEDLRLLDRLRGKLETMDGRHRPAMKAVFLATYQGEAAAAEARRAHFTTLHDGEMVPALPFLAQKLRTESIGRTVDYRRYYFWYRTWRMLQDPAARLRIPEDAKQAAAGLTDYWTSAGGTGDPAEYQGLLQRQLEYASRFPDVLAELFPPRRVDRGIDETAKVKLRMNWSEEGLYPGLVQAATGVPAITLSSFVGEGFGLSNTVEVPGAYTEEGWKGPVREYLDWVAGAGEDWALKDSWDGDPPVLRDRLLSRYADEFNERWLQFLGGTAVDAGMNDKESRDFVERAASENSPLLKVLRGVDESTRFAERAESGLSPILDEFQVVHEFFHPPGKGNLYQRLKGRIDPQKPAVDEYLKNVGALKEAYADIAKSEDPSEAQEVGDLESWVATHMSTDPVGSEMERLLTLPSQAITKKFTQKRAAGIASGIQSEWSPVYREYQQNLAGKYPFNPGGAEAVALSDFEGFFGPGGTFWKFYERSLSGKLAEDGSELPGVEVEFTPALRNSLRAAYRIRRAFFPSGGGAGFSLTLTTTTPTPRPPGVSWFSTTLSVGGESITQKSGPPLPSRISWPGENPPSGASLSLNLRSSALATPITGEGEWGFFRLLDRAKITSSGGEVTLTWTVDTDKGDLPVAYRVSGLPAIHPLEKGLLRFSCPESITAPRD
jgi:type VI secretion system protein ImpL